MFMTLPDGVTKFRMVPPNQIPLTLLIRVQKLTGIGAVGLQARLAANQVRVAEMMPLYQRMQQAQTDGDTAAVPGLVRELEQAAAEGEIDLLAEGVHVWVSRVMAGEPDLSLDDACDFPLWEAVRELEPEEQAQLERAQEEEEQKTPTSAAGSNGHSASGSELALQPETATSTPT
jgi:hypothetical protein